MQCASIIWLFFFPRTFDKKGKKAKQMNADLKLLIYIIIHVNNVCKQLEKLWVCLVTMQLDDDTAGENKTDSYS